MFSLPCLRSSRPYLNLALLLHTCAPHTHSSRLLISLSPSSSTATCVPCLPSFCDTHMHARAHTHTRTLTQWIEGAMAEKCKTSGDALIMPYVPQPRSPTPHTPETPHPTPYRRPWPRTSRAAPRAACPPLLLVCVGGVSSARTDGSNARASAPRARICQVC